MATYLVPPHARWSFPAGSASLAQFQFVTVNSSGQIITPASSGVYAFVLDDAPAIGSATITNDMLSGNYTVGAYYGVFSPQLSYSKVIAGASLSIGTVVQTDVNGHAVAQLTGGVALGVAISAASSGDYVTVAPA